MCNHYRLHPEAISDWAIWAGYKQAPILHREQQSDIWPKRSGIVARVNEGEKQLDVMTWGVPLTLAGKRPGTTVTKYVTNVRVLSSPFWRGALANPAQRCLVLFSRFAEPGSGKDLVTGRPAEHWFEVNHTPIAVFAGIWRPSQAGNVYAFLTCAPNALVNPYHEKAMPVILMPEDYDRWLSGNIDDVKALQAPFPSQIMGLSVS